MRNAHRRHGQRYLKIAARSLQAGFNHLRETVLQDESRPAIHHRTGDPTIDPEVLKNAFQLVRVGCAPNGLRQWLQDGPQHVSQYRWLAAEMSIEGRSSHSSRRGYRGRRDRVVAFRQQKAVERCDDARERTFSARVLGWASAAITRQVRPPSSGGWHSDKAVKLSDTSSSPEAKVRVIQRGVAMRSNELTRDRQAAWCVGLPAVLFVAVVLHHPVLGVARNASTDEILAGVSRMAVTNAVFHAGVLLMLSVQAIGLWSFVERLGLDSLWVRAGVFFYAISTVMLMMAGTIDGFATPMLGVGCNGSSANCAVIVATGISVESGWIQAFTKTGLSMQALGTACWAATLAFTRRGSWQLGGLIGLLVALAPIVELATSGAAVGPGRLASLMSSGCVCMLGAAVFLWTGATALPRSTGASASDGGVA